MRNRDQKHDRSPHCLLRLWRAREGVTALEFAFVAPVLMMFIFGVMEFSLIMLVAFVMESATNTSSRLGSTGYIAEGNSRTETLRQAVLSKIGNLLDDEQLTVTAKYYEQFDDIGDAEPWNDTNGDGVADPGEYTDINGNGEYDTDMGLAGFGDANDIVVYTLTYPWTVMTPVMGHFIGNDEGKIPLSSYAVVKNEPY